MHVGMDEENARDCWWLDVVGPEVNSNIVHYSFQMVSGVEKFD